MTNSGKVLLIDDSETIRHHAESVLRKRAPELSYVFARDGLDGFKQLATQPIDLVLCDVVMPGLDGFRFLALKKSRAELADIPVIMLTGASDVSEKVRALEAGASDYLTKPFHDEELLARVRVHLKLRRLQAELHEKNLRLEEISTTDALTSLKNRRYLMLACEIELARARRYGTPLSLVMGDIDHFKKINDTHGHLGGDRVLQVAGELLRNSVRQCDVAARYGGEEIALLLPHTDADGAMVVAERVRAALAQREIPHEDSSIQATISLGVASINVAEERPIESLFQRADRALYEAKAAGRNRVAQAPSK